MSDVHRRKGPSSTFTLMIGSKPLSRWGNDGTHDVTNTSWDSDETKVEVTGQRAAQNLDLTSRLSRGVSQSVRDGATFPSRPFDWGARTNADPRFGHDFGKVLVHAGATGMSSGPNDQTPVQSGGLDDKFTQGGAPEPAAGGEPKQDINLGADETKAPALPIVDSVEMVTSSTGAIGGFPEIDCQASLNQPGPYNDQAFRGSVANVHQVHFHLSQGYPGDLRATRMVNRTALRRGMNFPKSGNDGPPGHEYMYTKDKMVIADAPGWCKTLTDPDFPVNYKADFSMYAWDAPTKKILASISYHVEIEKTHYSQPGPINTVTVTDTKIGGAVTSPVKPAK